MLLVRLPASLAFATGLGNLTSILSALQFDTSSHFPRNAHTFKAGPSYILNAGCQLEKLENWKSHQLESLCLASCIG